MEGAGLDRVWGVSYRLKLQLLARRAAGSHGAGGAVVAGTAGRRHSSSASIQGNFDARFSIQCFVPVSINRGSLGSRVTSFQTRKGEFGYLLEVN